MHIFRFADDRPANPVARHPKTAAHVSPSPGGEGRGEDGRHHKLIFTSVAPRFDRNADQTQRRKERRVAQRQKSFSAFLRALRVSAFILSAVCKLTFHPSGVAASRQSAAFFSFIFRWRLSPKSRYAPELAERVDFRLRKASARRGGDFSTALRPHGEHPPIQSLRPPDSAAEAGALQTLCDFRHNRVGQCFQPVSIQKIRDNATSPPSTRPSPPGEGAADGRFLVNRRRPANPVARYFSNAADNFPSPP